MYQTYFLILLLLISVFFIVFMTTKVKMHAFFVLILAAIGVGILGGLKPDNIILSIKQGFGDTLEAIGIVIVTGTSMGIVLEKTGAAYSIANLILKCTGKKNTSLAVSIIGLVFGIPIFCDSGFVILSPLNKSLAKLSRTSIAVMAVSLSTSLLAVHCFMPPHPGPTAAAGIIGIDLGQLMIFGLIMAVPTAGVGLIWANTFGKKYHVFISYDKVSEEYVFDNQVLPNPYLAFVPVILPILLIAIKSILTLFIGQQSEGFLLKVVAFTGEPAIALLIGLIVSFTLIQNWKKEILDDWLGEGVKNAGSILAITAAGGAFGSVLKATGLGSSLGNLLAPLGLGIFLPFLIAAGLKTAQGSSTVSIITTSSLVMPFLQEIHLNTGIGPIITVLSICAGSMVVSHANDSYFWVVTKFSDLDMDISLKVFTTATMLMGITAELIIYILSLFFI